MFTRLFPLAAGGLLIGICPASAQGAGGQPSGPATVAVQQTQALGSYLTDERGRALYMFTSDSKGSSACYDACAQAWPPILTAGQPKAGQGVKQDMIGTLQRRDGAMQVTYNGMPLYYFVQDQAAGSTAGQDKHGFDGEWYLVSPQGEKIEKGG